MADLDLIYPALSDLRKKAQKRLPKFAFEYLDSATGTELGAKRNRAALDQILFMSDILKGPLNPQLETTFLGQSYATPFGIAPLGFSGVIWPNAEQHLARHAAVANIPYCLSTVATQTPEEIGPIAGKDGWFQLYPPKDEAIELDMLDRIKSNGFETLIVTLDVPGESRRERQRRALLTLPFRFTPSIMWQLISHPHWSLAFALNGVPRMKFMEGYERKLDGGGDNFVHVGRELRAYPDWDHLKRLRKAWTGPMIVKGILDHRNAKRLAKEGVDAIWVSNHGGRQLEAAPASITELPKFKDAVPDMPLIFDSGVAGGLDIMRALSLGADFVMLGRAWHYALGALGAKGAAQCHNILSEDMMANMKQIGAEKLSDIPTRLYPVTSA
ncbi:MAG: alpha-hydroxy acid oxidase [Pseudomonadota bacterium]